MFARSRGGGDDPGRAGDAGAAQAAVAPRFLGQVLLVVVLREVELAGGHDLGRDRAVAGAGERGLVGVARLLGRPPLLVGADADHRAVLRAHVVALAHALRGVVLLPERLEQVAVGDAAGVVDHAHGLGVAGAARAHFLVRGVGRGASLVADGGGEHAIALPELALGAPEAAQRA